MLLQRSIVLIVESSTPAFAAAVAAPDPEAMTRKVLAEIGPDAVPLAPMQPRTAAAATGHSGQSIFPIKTLAPLPNWSDFDLFGLTCNILGSPWLSTAISPQLRCSSCLQAFALGVVISPEWKKQTKKHRIVAAYSIRMSGSLALGNHLACI